MLFIVGIAWGYHLEPLHQKLPDRKLAYFEPIAEVVHLLADRYRELQDAAHRILNEKELSHARLRQTGIHIYILPQYKRLFPDIEQKIHDALGIKYGDINSALNLRSVDQATTSHFFGTWARNFFRMIRSEGCIEFFIGLKAARNRKLLYCGAAPDLLAVIAGLKKESLRKNFYIIAADTALAPLLACNIRPDIVISLDSGRGTAFHFAAAHEIYRRDKGPNKSQIRFDFPVLSWTAGASFLAIWFSHIIRYRSSFPFDQMLASGPLALIPEWPNPARNPIGIALHLCRLAQAKELLTAGTSFKLQDGESHARGTGYSYFARLEQCRTNPLENYRPGGYKYEYTEKNRTAVEGVEKLAREFSIKIRPLQAKDFTPDKKHHDKKLDGANILPELQSIASARMADFLDEFQKRVPAESWELPIARERIARWFRLKNSHISIDPTPP